MVPRRSRPPGLRIVEFGLSFLLAFLVITLMSFLSLRPQLQEVRSQVVTEWQDFLTAVKERNEIMPGLIEAVRGFEPGHARLAQRLLEARGISMRVSEPDKVVAAVDVMDKYLAEVEKLQESNPRFREYPPFAKQWSRMQGLTLRIKVNRELYNKSVDVYNRLLKAFPQSLFTTLFGFVPLQGYPVIEGPVTQPKASRKAPVSPPKA
ncbi:MAG: LemA family protein [Thermodesulfobacteriota bacterium]